MASIFELAQLEPYQLVYEFFLPFILTLILLFFGLQMIRIFSRKTNLILSLILTIMVAASPLFATIASLLSQIGAFAAVGVFVVVFIVGALSWGVRKGRESIEGMTSADAELNRLYKRRAKLIEEIERTSSDSKRASKYDELEHLDKRIRHLELVTKHHYR